MNTVDHLKLSEVFEIISKPRFILGTTYTLSLAFFESVLVPYLDRSNLAACLIIADSIGYDRALTEGGALQGAAQWYQVVPASVAGCFHPKVWLILGDGHAVLLTGSGNLTQAGFVNNAELFDAIKIDAANPAPTKLIASIRNFISGLSNMWPKEDVPHLLCVESLADIADEVAKLPTMPDGNNDPLFIHSFNGQLLDQLPSISDASQLYVASPFFGGSLEGLSLLLDRFPKAKPSVFPAIHGGKATDIPISRLSTTYPDASVAALTIPSKEGRLAHLKLYGIETASGEAFTYCTSANCTKAAWGGTNVEAGLFRQVVAPLLGTYFIPSKLELPNELLSYQPDSESVGNLHIFSVDEGSRLGVFISAASSLRLPLRSVRLTARSGSHISSLELPNAFHDTRSAYIEWLAFPNWQRRRNMAVCLEVQAESKDGTPITGRCFVENRPLLTADPIHRSAWRGALLLLEDEGAPELADIAALFSLAQDVLSGTLGVAARTAVPPRERNNDETEEAETTSVVVWPPQPDLSDLRRRIGHTAAGRLQWFQRIFQTFLPSHEDNEATQRTSIRQASADDQDDDADEDQTRKEAEASRAESAAIKVWKRAEQDYERLRHRLFELMPNESNAHHVWPASVFAFLSMMAIFRAARRLSKTAELDIRGADLCDDFLRLMLQERKQGDDFCCPRHYRYRTEKFPALAQDLRSVFHLYPHADLSKILLSLIADHTLRADWVISEIFLEKRVCSVCAPDFRLDAEAIDTCRRAWSRYIKDDNSKKTDAEFTAMLMKFAGWLKASAQP